MTIFQKTFWSLIYVQNRFPHNFPHLCLRGCYHEISDISIAIVIISVWNLIICLLVHIISQWYLCLWQHPSPCEFLVRWIAKMHHYNYQYTNGYHCSDDSRNDSQFYPRRMIHLLYYKLTGSSQMFQRNISLSLDELPLFPFNIR